MDGARFDAVTRALAAGTSRRGLLAGLAGLATAGSTRALAACPSEQVSRHGLGCICKTTGRPPDSTGHCPCASGLTRCGDACVNLTNNLAHCGACDAPCAGGSNVAELVCRRGTCAVGQCAPGWANCDGDLACETPLGTNTNCSACGDVCYAEMGMSCQAGSCAFTTCFVAGTRVAMADGTSRPIELVSPGDRVLGRAGRVNTVVALDRTRLGDRLLYALNDGHFFVTAEHPFWTMAGWKSIDPAATAAENPTLPVGKLAVGDRLLALAAVAVPVGAGNIENGENTTELEVRPLHRITGRPGDPATPLYNLLLDGDHTYFADDLLVHNKE